MALYAPNQIKENMADLLGTSLLLSLVIRNQLIHLIDVIDVIDVINLIT